MSNPNASFPAGPQISTLFQEELAQAAAMPGLQAAGPALWPRFAGYYRGLTRLPRRLRRDLQRRWRRSLGGIALLLALGQAPALAATIVVDGTSCTLVDAITAANNDQPTGGCPGGSSADTITFPANSTHTLTAVNNTGFDYGYNGLPLITSAITIQGNGSTITRDSSAPLFRILLVGRTGNLSLQETTVSGGQLLLSRFALGGGVSNHGTLTVTNSTIAGNSAILGGGGVFNVKFGTMTITNSTISGNSGGGVDNDGTMTITNSTISGNSGGGIDNDGTMAATNSTLSGNTAGQFGGGVSNAGTLILIQTLVSGNTASARGPEAYNYPGGTFPAGTVIANNLNLFGHDGVTGVYGFAQGPTDKVPSAPLAAILNPTLGDNGGLTRTHALVAGSPAADAIAAASCAAASDQRGFIRPQDSNADTLADCDIGAFELGLPAVETVAADPNPQSRCTRSRCDIRIKCNVDPALGTPCTNRIRFFVRERDLRLSAAASTTAPRRIRFAFGVANVPPGETANLRLRLTKRARQIVRTSTRRRLPGVMEIRNSAGTVSSTPIRMTVR